MHIEKKTLRNIFIGVISCIVLYWILHETERVIAVFAWAKGLLSPFLIGSCLAFIANVPMRGFEVLLKGVKQAALRRLLAILLTFLAFLVIIVGVFWLLIPQLIETIQSLIPKLYNFITSAEGWFKSFLQQNPQLMQLVLENTDLGSLNWAELAQKMISVVSSSVTTILGGTFSAIGSITGGLVDGVIAVVFAIYCLFQKENLARQGRKLLYAYLPEKFSDSAVRVLRLTNATFSNFLSGQCIEVCILGSMFAISMAIFRMPYIPLVSVLVAVTAFIPVVGAWVGCVFGAFLILVANPMQAVWFVIMFVVLQQIENNLIYPRVVGTSIGLSGMWVLVAVTVGGELMGVAGMFLMIPITSVIYTLLRENANRHLQSKDIAADKLQEHPPELTKKLKFKKKKTKVIKTPEEKSV